jgi:isoleucyl-tRNA synthetase
MKNIKDVEEIILNEVNVKNIELISSNDPILKKKAKVNFKVLGPKQGKNIKEIAAVVAAWSNEDIVDFETNKGKDVVISSGVLSLSLEDVDVVTADVPGWEIASSGVITVALDVSISDELREEGVSRDFVNKIQNNRKELGLEVTDFVEIQVLTDQKTKSAINNNLNYICSETLTKKLSFVEGLSGKNIFEEESLKYSIEKLN